MKTQNKKKNISLRIASGMAVVALLSTCAISSTFAKYTTSYEASDSARVAYWGFNQSSTTSFNLFKSSDTNIKSYNGTDNVIAPGSKGSASFSFAYTANSTKSINAPEVAYEFTATATATGNHTELDKNTNFKWTLKIDNGTEETYATVSLLASALNTSFGTTTEYEAGSLPTLVNKTYTIGWEWKFSTDATGDAADTALGNETTLEEIGIKITITATQKD